MNVNSNAIEANKANFFHRRFFRLLLPGKTPAHRARKINDEAWNGATTIAEIARKAPAPRFW